MIQFRKKKLLLILSLTFLFRSILAFLVWHPDLRNHMDWGIRFWEYGPKIFYSQNVWSFTWPNQPPGTMYLFAGVEKLFELVFSIFWWININIPLFPSNVMYYLELNLYPALLKLPAILADFGIAYLIFKLILYIKGNDQGRKLAILSSVIFLINPAVWYNSAVWGQYDSVVNFLALLSFYFVINKKLTFSVLFFALSLYTKASLLIFAPILIVIILKHKYKFFEILKAVGITILILGIITIPFAKGNPYVWLFNIYKDKVFAQQLQVITANAFNLWSALAGIHEKPQSLFLGPVTYQVWGLILFSLLYVPLLFKLKSRISVKNIIWVLSLTGLSSFILLTNMHERYLYPFFPVFTVISATYNLWGVYTVFSFINLINLYNFWWVPVVGVVVSFMSFGDRLMPRIFGAISFIFFLFIYKYYLRLFRQGKI